MSAKRYRLIAAIVFLALSGISRVLVPQWPGFWLTFFLLGMLTLLFYGQKRIASDLKSLTSPRYRRRLKIAIRFLLVLALILIAGSLKQLPVLSPGAASRFVLPEDTINLLGKLRSPVTLEAALGPMSQEERVRRLLELYQKASPLISTSVIKALVEAKATSKASDSLFELAKPDSITITSGNFSETINPITRQGIDASLRRLISPYRLVYNLTGDGEKSVLDQSPLGISQWAQALSESKIFVDDCLWVGSKLPPEALAAHALILAGPRRPLGEEREKALMDYLISGGKLIIFQDPMVVGFGAAALESIGLNLPWGLVVDPTSTWAGTEDFFIVSRDYPAHPVTLGLEQPVIWPLTGAVTVTSKANLPENPLDPVIAPQTDPTGPTGHTWAVALSSPAAWLETDRKSLAERSHRYQSQSDLPGQLVLASATTLSSGGRLMLLADADLAANSFINYAGNLAFLNNAIFWLLGAQDDLATSQAVTWLDLTDTKARLLFWLPTVIWPVLMIVIWFIWQFKRRRRASS